jgi:hypothetical protein
MEEAGTDLLLTILQGREPVTVIEAPMTALATTVIERDWYTPSATQLPDSSLEFAPSHYVISHIYVRYARSGFAFAGVGRRAGPTPLS